VGPRDVLNAVVKRKIPNPRRESNPRTPIVREQLKIRIRCGSQKPEGVSVSGRIMSKYILQKQDVTVGIGLNWLRYVPVAGLMNNVISL
jgi:hypothetical protein